MNFIILPSHRVALIKSLSKSISIAPFKAEQLVRNSGHNAKQSFVSLHYKTLSLYSQQNLAEPLFTASFPKKINSVAFNTLIQKPTVLVSDKFGDIYQVNSQHPTYLNSNLGIPSFLHCFEEYLILGDELSKIKIYNLKDSHQIYAIWYIFNSQPLDLKQLGDDKFILLSKYQDKQQLKQKEQIFCFKNSHLRDEEFPGVKIFEGQLSDYSKSNQIKSSTIVPTSDTSFAYIVLKQNILKIMHFEVQSQEKLQFVLGKTDSLELSLKQQKIEHLFATHDQKSKRILIAVGKEAQGEENIDQNIVDIQGKSHFQQIKLNKSESIIVYSPVL